MPTARLQTTIVEHPSRTTISTPIGRLTAVADGDGAVVGLYFDGHRPAPRHVSTSRDDDPAPFAALAAALDEYFTGDRRTFDDVPVRLVGTPFQQDVWAAVRAIPYGATATYADLAAQLGRDRAAARAVGGANARNPIAIVVPCHRLLAAGGGLAGYAGGEWRKRRLLALERERDR
jgi:methylated-DNA-[protein]-cysteine S-methyltransferase